MMSFRWWHHLASFPDHFLPAWCPAQLCWESPNIPDAFGVLGFSPCLWAPRALCWCHCSSALGHRNCLTLLPVNPTSCSCWSDCVSVLEKERKINHIAACGMGQVSPLSLCLLPGHYRINWRVFMLSTVWNSLFRSCRIPWNSLKSSWDLL